MWFSSVLVAITLICLSTLCHQTMGRSFPINVDQDQEIFCRPITPPFSTTKRTVFDTQACTVYGYPSTGGVLIKEANLLGMVFLSLPRFHASQRAPSAEEEDSFCNLLRRTGATLWARKEDWFEVQVGMRESTEEEQKVMVYGWPADGVGVWVLGFASAAELPRDFGRVSFAMDMEEKIQVMKEYGAIFVEDVTQMEELAGVF
ncbi:hypothetical protein BDW66DRAFT_159601 [Aspergillus desertorum]